MTRLFTAACVVIALYRASAPAHWPQLDAISVGLLVVALIPLLGPITELSIPGVIVAKFEKLTKAVEDIGQRQIVFDDQLLQGGLYASTVPAGITELPTTSAEQELEALASRYVSLRSQMGPSDQRTVTMTRIMQQMIEAARKIDPGWSGAKGWIEAQDPKRSLAAVAFIYAHPQQAHIPSLVDLVSKSTQAFIQYWALRAIRLAVDEGQATISPDTRGRLQTLQSAFPRDTDRGRLIRSINETLASH